MPTTDCCRARAADDDALAATDRINRRVQLEASAGARRKRADMFDRIGRSTVVKHAGYREARDVAAIG